MEIIMVTLTDFATFSFTPDIFFLAKSLDIPGINADDMADAKAMGILEIFVPFATTLKSMATTASSSFR